MTDPGPTATRSRRDLCPGILRPWPADDGALVRIRLVGGEISLDQLRTLSRIAQQHGDGEVHLTSRANLQLRALPAVDGQLDAEVVAALAESGLLPHPTHDLVRNVMVSPLTGLSGGRADLRPVARAYDELLCADAALADLPGKFLVVLDDGRGDLAGRELDLGAVAVDSGHAQVRAGGDRWGEVVPLDGLAARLVELAGRFLDVRGRGSTAAWHVAELPEADAARLGLDAARDRRTDVSAEPLAFGAFRDGVHAEVPDGVLTAPRIDTVAHLARTDQVIVTPWRGLVLRTG